MFVLTAQEPFPCRARRSGAIRRRSPAVPPRHRLRPDDLAGRIDDEAVGFRDGALADRIIGADRGHHAHPHARSGTAAAPRRERSPAPCREMPPRPARRRGRRASSQDAAASPAGLSGSSVSPTRISRCSPSQTDFGGTFRISAAGVVITTEGRFSSSSSQRNVAILLPAAATSPAIRRRETRLARRTLQTAPGPARMLASA